MKENKKCGCKLDKAEKMYPGTGIDTADKEKVDPKLVKERTKTLDNNPRNNY